MSLSELEMYPETVTAEGTVLPVSRICNHYCALRKISRMRGFIGDDAYDDIKYNSQVGVILFLAESNILFECCKQVVQLLSNMLVTSMPHELWVLADGRPIRFSLHEFEHITHLKCGMYAVNEEDVSHGDIWTELGLISGEGPSWNQIQGMLMICGHWSLARRKMVGLLLVLHVAIFGLHQNSRIPIYHAALVTDPETFERHPWGRVSFDVLFRSISLSVLEGPVMNLHGLVHVLQVWAFEHIPRLGEMFGRKRNGDIPLLQWTTRRPTRGCRLEHVFQVDRNESPDRKVRVVHLVEKRYEEIYPEWPGDGVDPKVDRMIRDILGGRLDETFWEARSGLLRRLLRGTRLRSVVTWDARRRQRGRIRRRR